MNLILHLTPGDLINSVVALATVTMAGATYYLARITRKLAEDTAAATRQANRHHQENLRPFCVIVFTDTSLHLPFGPDFDPQTRRQRPLAGITDQISPSDNIFVRGELRNRGIGPAKDVRVYLNKRLGKGEEGAFRLTRPVLVSGLVGVGETIAIDVWSRSLASTRGRSCRRHRQRSPRRLSRASSCNAAGVTPSSPCWCSRQVRPTRGASRTKFGRIRSRTSETRQRGSR